MTRVIHLPLLPDRPIDGHKGLFGRVLIVGGSETMLGAPVLAGTAALRMGSGLVQIAMPAAMLPAALAITPELIGVARSVDDADVLSAAATADVVAIGPGLGQAPASRALLLAMLQIDKPMVVDADGLNLLAAEAAFPQVTAKLVLTPHPGEMKRLAVHLNMHEVPTDDRGRAALAVHASKTFGQVVVLKGARTVIADGDRVAVNHTGNSSLSKAGTGDVLTGIIASLIGQGMERFEAAQAACWLHGKAGEIAGDQLGQRSVLATDVIAALPAAIQQYQRNHG